jgi:hypothetical protein
MRTVTRSVMQAPAGFWAFAYLEVTNFDGTWVNLGSLAVGSRTLNLFNTLSWDDNIDANTLSMRATLTREIGAFSLVPFRSDSPINVDDVGNYQPLLDLHRLWRIIGVFLPQYTYPDPGDYREIASGYLDRIDIQGEPATIAVQGRGMEADLIDRRIMFVDATADPLVPITSETPKTYASGTQADVIQAILDEELGAGVVTLTVDGSAPAEFVNGWDQTSDVGLFDLLVQVASLGGGSLRYRYDSSDVLSLTLYAVNRTPSNPDWQIDGDEYEKLDAGIDLSGIRNFVAVRYVDTNYGIQMVTSPVIVPPDPPTSASIVRYGNRPLSIDLSAETQVTDQTAAGNLADAVRADLEFPIVEQQIAGTGLWFADLGDYVKLLANGVHYNEDQYGGVTTYSHTFQNGELESTIGLRGKPAGRYRTWLDFGTGAPRTPYTPEITNLVATATEIFTGLVYVPSVFATASVNQYTQSVTFELSATIDFAVVLATNSVDVTNGTAGYGWVGSGLIDPNVIYYVRATPYSGVGATGVAGLPVIASTATNKLSPSQPDFDELVDLIGELDTSGAFDPLGSKTVFVQTLEDDQWLALSTIPTAEVEVGSEYRRQHFAQGAGQVRLTANVKAKTGSPTLKAKYSVNAFGAVADLASLAPAGTGLQVGAWVDMPTGAQADVGLALYVADGADTAALDLYAIEVEFKPGLVTAFRDFSDDFSDDFS